jgi:hypothetical protein
MEVGFNSVRQDPTKSSGGCMGLRCSMYTSWTTKVRWNYDDGEVEWDEDLIPS